MAFLAIMINIGIATALWWWQGWYYAAGLTAMYLWVHILVNTGSAITFFLLMKLSHHPNIEAVREDLEEKLKAIMERDRNTVWPRTIALLAGFLLLSTVTSMAVPAILSLFILQYAKGKLVEWYSH